MSDITGVLGLITATLTLLKGTEAGQRRKDVKLAWRNYKKIRRQLKKGGITQAEQKQLDELMDLLIKAQHKLLK